MNYGNGNYWNYGSNLEQALHEEAKAREKDRRAAVVEAIAILKTRNYDELERALFFMSLKADVPITDLSKLAQGHSFDETYRRERAHEKRRQLEGDRISDCTTIGIGVDGGPRPIEKPGRLRAMFVDGDGRWCEDQELSFYSELKRKL